MTPPITVSIRVPGAEDVQVVLDRIPRIIVPLNKKRIGRTRWRLIGAYVWYDGKLLWMIPPGYEWDGASVPMWAHWYEAHDTHLEASGPHDHGYTYKWLWQWQGWDLGWVATRVSKLQMDAMFRLILKWILGVRKTKARALRDFVLLGGWLAWWSTPCNNKCEECPNDSAGWCPYLGKMIVPGSTFEGPKQEEKEKAQ